MSVVIVLLLALAGVTVPLSLLARVSPFVAAHCPGLDRVPLPMRPTVKYATVTALSVFALSACTSIQERCQGDQACIQRMYEARHQTLQDMNRIIQQNQQKTLHCSGSAYSHDLTCRSN